MTPPNRSALRLSRRVLLGGAAAAWAGAGGRALAQPASENATLTLPGGRVVGATIYLPPKIPAPAVLMVHDRFGLTDVLRERAAALALDRYIVVCVDLFRGKLAQTPAEAEKLMTGYSAQDGADTVAGWANWIRADARCNRMVGLLGFGLGGEAAVQATMQTLVQALAVYYTPLRPARLNAPLLAHYSERNRAFAVDAVEDLQFKLQQTNKKSRVYLYDADPDFANPASPQFARSDALLAWNRTVAFFRANMGAGA